MNTVNITLLEAALIGKIYDSCFHDGRDPIGSDVWSEVDTQQDKGVMSSLIKKGIVAFWEEKKRGVSVESTNMLREEYRELIEQLRDNNWTPLTLTPNSDMATEATTEKGIFNRADKSVAADALKMTKPEFVKTYTAKTTGDAAKIGTAWHELRNSAAKKPSIINEPQEPLPSAKPEKTTVVQKLANAKLSARQEKEDRAAAKATEVATKAKERNEAKTLKTKERDEAKTVKAATKATDAGPSKEEAKAAKAAVKEAEKAERVTAKELLLASTKDEREKAKAEKDLLKAQEKGAKDELRKTERAVNAASKLEETNKGKAERAEKRKAEGAVAKEGRRVERVAERGEAAAQRLIDVAAAKADKAKERDEQAAARLIEKEQRADARAKERAEKVANRKTEPRATKPPVALNVPELAIANDLTKAKSERMRLLYNENPSLSVRDIALHLDAHYSFTYGVIEKHKMDLRIAKLHENDPKPIDVAVAEAVAQADAAE